MIKDHVSLNFDTVPLTGQQNYSCRSSYRRVCYQNYYYFKILNILYLYSFLFLVLETIVKITEINFLLVDQCNIHFYPSMVYWNK